MADINYFFKNNPFDISVNTININVDNKYRNISDEEYINYTINTLNNLNASDKNTLIDKYIHKDEIVKISYSLKIKGREEEGYLDHFHGVIELGTSSIPSIIEDNLINKKVGETITINIVLDEDSEYPNQKAFYEVNILGKVHEPYYIRELTNDVIKRNFSYDTIDEYLNNYRPILDYSLNSSFYSDIHYELFNIAEDINLELYESITLEGYKSYDRYSIDLILDKLAEINNIKITNNEIEKYTQAILVQENRLTLDFDRYIQELEGNGNLYKALVDGKNYLLMVKLIENGIIIIN